ncbi:MAG: tetratricopeptide repeat protein [Nitriliruptorales bacterium]|nr:tetratricopeptide repeat protein [Nitriliruptorales bacterium]
MIGAYPAAGVPSRLPRRYPRTLQATGTRWCGHPRGRVWKEVVAAIQGGAERRAQVLSFLFSDIEGSTRLLQRCGSTFATALSLHHAVLTDVIGTNGGVVRRIEGDSFFATFDSASAAVRAAVDAQRALKSQGWPDDCVIEVRIGIHTGETIVVGTEFVGLDVHRAARIMSVGWGGQILISGATAALLPTMDGVSLHDLGEHRLKDLTEPERLYQIAAADLRSDFPAPRTAGAVVNNLPTQLSSFIGREREAADVATLLERARLVTLTGPGGTGKTRLSLQVATDVADEYPDGVFFVPLAPVADPALVFSVVATTLGLRPPGHQTPLDLVSEHLQSRRALLVLDNFEQVLAAGIELSKLLGAAPAVRVLVSSRAALRLSGEQEYPVPPLPLPAPDDDLEAVAATAAVTLFVTRAAGVQPGFELTSENTAAIAEITRRLDGLPLAIELAAARVKLLGVNAIAARLSDALNLLSSGARDLPHRQRTLRGAVGWSHDLLDAGARRLFARCSVFRGGVDLDHLLTVCEPDLGGDCFDLLEELVDHSLMRRVEQDSGVRFSMLETIREYAAEQLRDGGEEQAVRQRHRAVYLALAEEAAPRLTGENSGMWLDRLERDHDNFRAALRYAVEGNDPATALRLVATLWRMWQIRGHLHEGRRSAELALAMPGADNWPAQLAAAYEAAGGIAYWQGDLSRALPLYTRALALYRSQGDQACVARATYNLAFSHGYDDPQRAAEYFEQALAAYQALGDELGAAKAHWGLSTTCFWVGDYDAMQHHAQLCVPVFRRAGATFDLAWSLHMAGLAAFAHGEHESARSMFTEALDLFLTSSDASGLYLVLANFALLSEASDQPERALRLLGAAARLGDETGVGLLEPQIDRYPRTKHAEDAFDAATVQALRAEGYAMSRDEAVAYMREG